MGRAAGFFDVEERLAGLSKKGDDLEGLAAVVDFELFRPELERAVPRGSKGGRPPFDHVLMFKILILQTQNNLSDERAEFWLRDRLTWMRFLGLGLGDAVPTRFGPSARRSPKLARSSACSSCWTAGSAPR